MNKFEKNFEESLGYLIGLARRALVNRINHDLGKAGHDVTCEQGAILMNLWKKNGQSQKELADSSCKDKTSVTRLIDGMEKRNLVVRIADKKDGRQKLIYLTNKGKELQKKVIESLHKTIDEAQQGISVRHLEACKGVLKKVAQNLS